MNDFTIEILLPVGGIILFLILAVIIFKKGNDVDWFFVNKTGWFGLILEAMRPAADKSYSPPKGLKFIHKEGVINDNYKEETLADGGWICPKCGNLNDKHTGTCGCGEGRKQ